MPDQRDPRKVFYYLYGDNPFAIELALQHMRAQLHEQADATLNHDRFDGRDLVFGSLHEAATSAPFLGQRRLIEIHEGGEILRRKDQRQQFLELLDHLPSTTALVMIHVLEIRNQRDLQRFQKSSDLLRWVDRNPNRGFQKLFLVPHDRAFAAWILEHVENLGGSIGEGAAQLLGEYVNDDPYLAHQEALKLLDYTDRTRRITRQDVEQLTPFYSQGDVFAMVDAVGQRQLKSALEHLHRLLAEEDPRYAYAMILRQFRMILLARSSLDRGVDPADGLRAHPFVIRKVTRQARNFDLLQLNAVYHRLFKLDVDSKIGKADLESELDRLVVDLAQ